MKRPTLKNLKRALSEHGWAPIYCSQKTKRQIESYMRNQVPADVQKQVIETALEYDEMGRRAELEVC
jgi:hypothetical protein